MSDHDDDRHSPGLQPFKVNYGPREETPPPFARDEAKHEAFKPSGDEGTSDCSHRNRPDIAQYERLHPLRLEEEPDLHPPGIPIKPSPPRPEVLLEPTTGPPSNPQTSTTDIANNALQLLFQKNCSTSPSSPVASQNPPKEPQNPPKDSSPGETLLPPEKTSPGVFLKAPVEPSPPNKGSPTGSHLSEYMISSPEGPSILPALDSKDNHHSHNHHTLPPIRAALQGITDIPGDHPRIPGSSPYTLPPVTAASPPALRTETSWELQRPAPFGGPSPQVPPSPYSHYSPASTTDLSAVSSPVSHHSYRRMPLKAEIPYINSSPYEAAVHPAKSPATSYPTPTDHQTPAGATPYSQPPSSSVPQPTGTYKCSHSGCNAPPFQTQYLLNSHAKVHSQDRPHFCPVEGCPRASGGKGFKRKNEMIRHGLVHNSPGYVCPFCPDQQHKYPRPDNLQRHVRVHHVDKNKDDPALRQVLAQRPEGSSRGRRRRAGP